MIVDGFFSYKLAAFLCIKSADAILKILKAYQIEVECQIDYKLKQV